MAIERMTVIALVPGVIAVESEVVQVPSEADAALLVEFEAVVFDRGLLAADLVLLRREASGVALALRDERRRAAALEVALWRTAHPQPARWRDALGLALVPLVMLAERLGLVARWLWRALCGRALCGRLRWDRWDRGNLSPLARMLLCVAFFAGAVLVWGR